MLAQSNDYLRILGWTGALFVGVLGLFLVVTFLRKRLRGSDEPIGIGFGLDDLRRMRDEGQLTDEEFERAKGKLSESLKAALERKREARQADGGGREGLEAAMARALAEQRGGGGGDGPDVRATCPVCNGPDGAPPRKLAVRYCPRCGRSLPGRS